ncbi:MAG TPA: MAPEG family protein [Anaeromyxobacteraceae bacterium]|nr:MAPEG family protein [Anaeromyxobacteraceae bacterium]
MSVPVPVTLLYGGLIGLLVTLLGANVSRVRAARGIGVQPVPPAELVRPIRAHGNAVEWAPLGLLLLLAVELSGAGTRFTLHLAGGSLLLGRVLHAVGILTHGKVQTLGAGITYLAMGSLAVWAIVIRFVQYGP